MSVVVDVSDISELANVFADFGNIVAEFLEEEIVPVLQDRAAGERNVRTGMYSGDWDVETNADSVDVVTPAYYWIFLEYGTSRGIRPVPVVHESASGLAAGLANSIKQAVEEV